MNITFFLIYFQLLLINSVLSLVCTKNLKILIIYPIPDGDEAYFSKEGGLKATVLQWVQSLLIILIFGCKSQVKDTKNIRTDFSRDREEQFEVAHLPEKSQSIEILPPRSAVNPETLKTESVTAKTDTENKNNSLILDVAADNDSDYVQFAACPQNSLENCSPTLQEPYSFANESHVFPDPPAGMIDIYIRSCVSKSRSEQYKTSCGKWDKIVFNQPKSYDSELRAILVEKYNEGQLILEECRTIETFMKRYKEKNPNGTGDLDSVVTNFLNHISPESCKEIMLLEDWTLLNKYASKTSSLPTPEIVTRDTSILLTLGVPLMIAGLISSGVGFYSHYRYDPKYAHFLLYHKKYFLNAKSNYKNYYYSEAKDVDFQLKRMQAYEIAIQKKLGTVNPGSGEYQRWLNESNEIKKETQYLETYKKYFVTDHTQTSVLKSSKEYNNLTIRELTDNFEKIQSEITLLKKLNSVSDSDHSIIILNNELKKMQNAYDRNYKSLAPVMSSEPNSPWKRWSDLTVNWDSRKASRQIEFSAPISTFLDGSEVNGALRKTGAIAATIGGIMIMVEAFSLSDSSVKPEVELLNSINESYSKINKIRQKIFSD